jgi:putative DNA-invertase from lambdoid prophage Rac
MIRANSAPPDAFGISSWGASGAYILTVLAALAEWEVSRTAERIRDVKASQREQGRYLGGRLPFGYKVTDGRLVPDPREQQALKTMRRLHKTMSLRSIAQKMQQQGFSLTAEGIRQILARKGKQQ